MVGLEPLSSDIAHWRGSKDGLALDLLTRVIFLIAFRVKIWT
jgi:hypothetical protein